MGCEVYSYKGKTIIFGDSDEGCLCTFPDDFFDKEVPFENIVRKLAMLGMAIILIQRKLIKEDEIFLPDDLPYWFRKELDRVLPRNEEY